MASKIVVAIFSITLLFVASSIAQADSSAEILAGNEAAQRGNLDAAISHFTKAIEAGGLTKPNLAVAYNNRGSAWDDKGQLDKALKDYSKAIENDPSYHEAYFNRSQTHERKSLLAKALEDAKKAAALSPQDEEYTTRVGQIQAKITKRK